MAVENERAPEQIVPEEQKPFYIGEVGCSEVVVLHPLLASSEDTHFRGVTLGRLLGLLSEQLGVPADRLPGAIAANPALAEAMVWFENPPAPELPGAVVASPEPVVFDSLVNGRLLLGKTGGRVYIDGREVLLSAREGDILRLLVANAGRGLTREEIWAGIDLSPPSPHEYARTGYYYMRRLRKRLGPLGDVLIRYREGDQERYMFDESIEE